MATIDQVCAAIQSAVISILDSADGIPPGQVGIGWPFGVSLTEILGDSQAQVTIYPITRASKNRTDRKPKLKTISKQTVTLGYTITQSGSAWIITFTGTPAAGFNVHTFVGKPYGDAYYQTLSSDTLTTIATAVKNAINGLGLSGVSATASGAAVTVTGSSSGVDCNIGGTATMVLEARRTMTPVQVSVWAADGDTRNTLSALIENGLALGTQPFLTAADGSLVWVRQRNAPNWVDDAQESYSLYESHLLYECEYPTLQEFTGTTVEAVEQTVETEDADGDVIGTTTTVIP